LSNFGTYEKEDVVFLLKDISNLMIEEDNTEREMKIQNGGHYSQMLPIEKNVSKEYLDLYKEQLENNKEKLAYAIGVMSEKIIRKNGEDVVLVSLARAGTPIGVLAKRYLKNRYDLKLNHYTISIIRDKGIDINAIRYIIDKHPYSKIQFVDGWTGKGTICRELDKACEDMKKILGVDIDSTLAVLADPAGYASIYGVREDFLIPSACLNSTVSGLISRTVLRHDLIGKDDFHGAKFYKELIDKDESINYIQTIESCFKNQYEKIDKSLIKLDYCVSKIGDADVLKIKQSYDIKDKNFIKPGVGETTRVLLRRIPDKILVKDLNDKSIEHIFILAKEKSVEVVEMDLKAYRCCGIIKNLKDI
jgi:hypothetical protein